MSGFSGLSSRVPLGQGAQPWGFQVLLGVENLPASAGDAETVSIPRSGRSPGGGHSKPLQCSCQENPMHTGAWGATVHGLGRDLARMHTCPWLWDLRKHFVPRACRDFAREARCTQRFRGCPQSQSSLGVMCKGQSTPSWVPGPHPRSTEGTKC